MSRDGYLLFGLALLLIVSGAFWYGATAYQRCNEKGGTLVRGVIGFECIGGRP